VDEWKRISLEEFPEKFKINLIATGRKKDNPKISETDRKFGINRDIFRSRFRLANLSCSPNLA
jgi:hypothetical protein